MRTSILFLLVTLLMVLGLYVRNRRALASRAAVEELTETLARADTETEADVQFIVANAASSDRAILFIHVDWAPMEYQRWRFANFAMSYAQTHPESNVLFYYVDCTPVTSGYRPLHALDGWSELMHARGDRALIHGNGEVVWLQHGHVLEVQPILGLKTTSALLEKTDALFF